MSCWSQTYQNDVVLVSFIGKKKALAYAQPDAEENGEEEAWKCSKHPWEELRTSRKAQALRYPSSSEAPAPHVTLACVPFTTMGQNLHGILLQQLQTMKLVIKRKRKIRALERSHKEAS